jgi:hypothetical protein
VHGRRLGVGPCAALVPGPLPACDGTCSSEDLIHSVRAFLLRTVRLLVGRRVPRSTIGDYWRCDHLQALLIAFWRSDCII